MVARVRLDDEPKPRKNRKGFEPGHEKKKGRVKGVPNKITFMVKEAILQATALSGEDKRGKGGAVGYLKRIADYKPELFVRLLERLLPYQVTGKDGGPVQMTYETIEDVKQRMKERGLPVPVTLTQLPVYVPTHDAPEAEQ